MAELTATKFSSKAKASSRNKKTRTRSEVKAGIVFPISRIHRKLRQGRFAKRISKGASVYLSSVMEYLAAEVLELSGNAAKDSKVKRLIPRHIMFAIFNDNELSIMLNDIIIPNSGVIPHIHGAMLTRGKSRADYFKYHKNAPFDDAPQFIVHDGDELGPERNESPKPLPNLKSREETTDEELQPESETEKIIEDLIRQRTVTQETVTTKESSRTSSIDVGKELEDATASSETSPIKSGRSQSSTSAISKKKASGN